MSKVIFAQTRHRYGSYADFFALATLSGYPTCYVDEIDPDSDNCYIFSPANGEITGWDNPRARIIHWLLEWPTADDLARPIPGVETWVSNATYARKLGALVRFVPMGSHPGLATTPPPPYEARDFRWDVALLMYRNGRRQAWIDALGDLSIAPDGWGDDRTRVLHQSRFMLHIDQFDDVCAVPPLRLAIAAAHRVPLVAEYRPGAWSLLPLPHLPRWSCAQDVRDAAGMPNYMRLCADELHAALCVDRDFRTYVEAAL